jgi:hypothetical protein
MGKASFLTPGVLYISSGVASEFRFLKPAFGKAHQAGYTRFIEPASGGLAMCHLSQQAGWPSSHMEASDVTLFSTVLGYSIMSRSLDDLEIRIQGFEDHDLLDPATVIWAQAVCRAQARSHQYYWSEIAKSMLFRKAEHIAEVQSSLDRASTLLSGLSYRPMDLFEHLNEAMQDPKALISLNPPSTGGGYEKFFNTGDRVSWKEPLYSMFDPVEGYARLDGYMQSSSALLAIYEENQGGHQVQGAFVARGSGRKAPTDKGIARSINYYIVSNRPDEFQKYTGGILVEPWSPSPVQPGSWPLLPSDYEITTDTQVTIDHLPISIADYYRSLWTHKFVGAPVARNMGLFLDGHLFGVMGFDPAYINNAGRFGKEASSVCIQYGMTVPSSHLRLNRLLGRLALCRDTLFMVLSHVEMYRCDTLITSQMSPYPESKEYRGIMKMVKRKPDPLHGYRLTYQAPISDMSWQQALSVFLEDEQRWSQARQQSQQTQAALV